MSASGEGTPPSRRTGEIAAWVSAITAVVGLLLAVFGVPLVGGSSVGRTNAGNAGAPDATVGPDATPSGSSQASPPSQASSPSQPSPPSQPAPPAVPKGWHRVGEGGLTVVFALPGG
ncbi:hypothetical protein [Streptomyces sp. NPDC087538]|uniref:hypothetical protein n=1 Tax=Streptomyces sp. NPDC087538 TaxID=3365797 RepID=UPI0037FBD82C